MSNSNAPKTIEEELAELEEAIGQVIREMSSTRTVRETIHLAEVTIPHHLQSIAKGKVHSLGRLPRARDMRIEEVVKDQLTALRAERSEPTASREFDRLKATDWSLIRSEYADLYNKAIREGNLIIAQKRKGLRG
jgi:hypothetical protein